MTFHSRSKALVHSASLSGADILSIHGLGTAQMISAGREGAEEAAAERGVDESGRTKLGGYLCAYQHG